MSQLKVNSIVPVNGLPSGANGGIIQVVQTVKTDVFTHNSTSFADITGLSATITPSSNSSKILCDMRIYISLGTVSGSTTAIFNLVRGSTNIAQPAGSNVHNATLHNWSGTAYMSTPNMNFLDSPATTSATTYKLQWKIHTGSHTAKINGYFNNTQYNSTSTMTLQEVTV